MQLTMLRYALSAALVTTACTQPRGIPPEPAPPGGATFVSASFDLTWTAAIDHFAIAGIPVADVDRGSGTIETERVAVEPTRAIEYADCGSAAGGMGGSAEVDPYLATSVVYEVLVSDNRSSSSVLANASWDTGDPPAPYPCETKGVWEREAQEAIRLVAEANR